MPLSPPRAETSTWVVVPTYDEADNVVPLVRSLRSVLATIGTDGTILVVDDDSPDGTGHTADRLAATHRDVRVLHRAARTGLAAAYRDGFAAALAAGADAVIQMDADFSHDPTDVPRLLAELAAGADVAIGSRYVPGGATLGWHPARLALSRAGGAYARRMLGSDVRDLTGGFKAWRADALRRVALETVTSQGYAFQVELTHRAEREALRVTEIPIVFRERLRGSSKMSAAIALEAAWRVPMLRFHHRDRSHWQPQAARV